ncbi:hypothetical protein HQ520_08000 [bacterium]|nr:hypothetical protein [bacterium]
MADRVIRVFLGAIAVLLAALVLQNLLNSPQDAQAGYTFPGSSKTYDVKLISEITVPDKIESVVPLGSNEEYTAATFAVQTDKKVYVYHCNYFPQGNGN